MAGDAPETPEPLPAESAPISQSGSRVREYLSNERTYLAWMRTAISLMAFGVIIARIHAFQLPLDAEPVTAWRLGLILSLSGLLTIFLSTQHYLVVRRDIADDFYRPIGRWVILFSIIVMLLGTGILCYAFTSQ